MKYKVLSFNESQNFHVCEDETHARHKVDLFVDGHMPHFITHENIVGQTVEVEYLLPYITIGMGAKISPTNPITQQ